MSGGVNNQLRLFMERIDRLEEEKKGMSDDIRDVYSEAKLQGYDPKIMKQLRKLMKMSKDDRDVYEATLDTCRAAIGLDGTPLGDFGDSLIEGSDGLARPPSTNNMSLDGGAPVPLDLDLLKRHIGNKLGVN